eukprot:jgi/Botrbrau1/2269/Bobra.101_2s0092.1
MLRLHRAWPVLSVFLHMCYGTAKGSLDYTSTGDIIGLPVPSLGYNLSFESTSQRASQVDTLLQLSIDGNGTTHPSAASSQYADELCPTYNLARSGVDVRVIRSQVEACLNEMRENPRRFENIFPCDYERMIAPLLTSEGNRFPLQTNSPAAVQFLSMAAQEDAAELAALGSLSNASSEAQVLYDRLARVGLNGVHADRVTAAGFTDVRSLIASWMCSPEHSNVLMGCSFDTASAGVAFSDDGSSLFSVLDFACFGNCSTCSGSARKLPGSAPLPKSSISGAPAGKLASSKFGGAQGLDTPWDDSQYTGITRVRVWVCNVVGTNTICGLEVSFNLPG